MITSYMPIHHVEHYHGQYDFERARACQVRRVAEQHGVTVRIKPDGDTSYLQTYVYVPELDEGEKSTSPDLREEVLWEPYVEFLMDLEVSNLGYLLHEVDTEAEYELVESLLYIGDESPRALACSLRYVDVDYRGGS